MVNVKSSRFLAGLFIIPFLAACSAGGGGAAPRPTPPLGAGGLCGDGACSGSAQNCSQDCAASSPLAPIETPASSETALPAFEAATEPNSYWVTNPSSGARLYVRVIRPDSWDGAALPALTLVPGGNGFSAGFLRPPRSSAQTIADAGFIVILFDPDGRGQSEGVEGQNGFIQQDGLAAVIQFAASLPEVDAARMGLVSFSFGITMAAGALARAPDLPVQFLLDWEGPADRNDTGGCDADRMGHLAGEVACDDEVFWSEREAVTFMGQLPIPYQRLQSERDHVQPDVNHAILMVNTAVTGGVPWVRLNDLPPNQTYDSAAPPPMLSDDLDRQLDAQVIQYAQALFGE